MTPRKRFLETLLFGSPDKVPLEPGHGRESTRAAWHAQGLPTEVSDIAEYAYRQAGGTHDWPRGGRGFPVDTRMIPQFEEKVLERRARSQVVQDWKGNICEIGNEFTVEYLRAARDFCTRRWIRCPVESWADWEAMQARYDAESPARLPDKAPELGRELADRAHVVGLGFPGPFWQLREWVGFEGLCLLFYDDPALVRDMVRFWERFIARLLERTFACTTLDFVHVSEDCAYKRFCMASPATMREFMLPTYRTWGEIARGAGCPIYAMDSDGFIGELIPLWIEAGINVCDPIEVAAGNDLAAFRRDFGRKMAYRGGIDKRAMAKGGTVIAAELARLAPIIADGGYIPGCDHAVPADVSWPCYVDYVGRLARLTGWL